MATTATTESGTRPAHGLAGALAREEDKLLACVHCGFCLPACPTYTRLGDEADSPRGRLYLMRAVVEGRLDADADAFARHIDRCLGCRACETVCPSGVEYGSLLEQARAVLTRSVGSSPAARLLLGIFGSRTATRFALAGGRLLRATRLARLLARRLPARFGRARLALAMLAATAPASTIAGTAAGRGAAASATGDRAAMSSQPADAPTVALLDGCVQDGLFGRVNRATARVLRANGCRIVPAAGQACCGALHAHGGDLEKARTLARSNIAAFEAADAERVVVNAAGCGAAMKEYGELLADDAAFAERARAFGERVRDVSELLAELGPVPGSPLPVRVTYDAPCHLHHAQRVTRPPLDVLETVPGLELVPLPGADECCGGAGIYGLLHPQLGGHILRDKVEAVRSTGADVVVTPNPGCIMQIGAGLLLDGDDTAVLHPIELIDESYRRAGFYDDG